MRAADPLQALDRTIADAELARLELLRRLRTVTEYLRNLRLERRELQRFRKRGESG